VAAADRLHGEKEDEEHGGRVVHAGLGLERRHQPGWEPQPAEGGEDRRRVGRGEHRPVEEGEPPVEVEDEVDGDPDDGRAGQHPERGERGGDGEHRAEHAPPRGQPALRDDHDERAEAERAGELGVFELDAHPRLAQRDADRQVDEEAGQAQAGGEAHRADGHEHDDRPHEQGDVQPVSH
jgi:hypothetical protein